MSVASTLARLAAGDAWELRGFRNAEERAAYQAVIAEVAAAKGIAVTMDANGTSLTVVRSG